MLTENKFSKYFLYAIGEIILVVIGILIALQINNWNENRKIENIQEKYLVLIKKEAQNNIESISSAKTRIENSLEAQKELINLIDGLQDTITEKNLSSQLVGAFYYVTSIQLENSVLSELKTTGELKNILNDSIREQLVALEPLISNIKSQEASTINRCEKGLEIINNFGSARTHWDDSEYYMDVGINKSNKAISNIPLLKRKIFENILLDYLDETFTLSSYHYPLLENHLKQLVKIIDLELESYRD